MRGRDRRATGEGVRLHDDLLRVRATRSRPARPTRPTTTESSGRADLTQRRL
jgi:hypothetical protein